MRRIGVLMATGADGPEGQARIAGFLDDDGRNAQRNPSRARFQDFFSS
jgi:hypothetical protein